LELEDNANNADKDDKMLSDSQESLSMSGRSSMEVHMRGSSQTDLQAQSDSAPDFEEIVSEDSCETEMVDVRSMLPEDYHQWDPTQVAIWMETICPAHAYSFEST
jgi:hypothetical protein